MKRVEPDMQHNPMNALLVGDQPGNTGSHSAKPPPRGLKAALALIAALLVFVTIGVAAWSGHKPACVVQGEVETTEAKVVAKAVGRVQAVHVCQGDKVRKGQLLVSIENQELQAKLEQARAAMDLAKIRDNTLRAVCAEYICAQSNWWVKAKAMAGRKEQIVAHSRSLQKGGVISLQELQHLESDLDEAQSCERVAKASFALAVALFGGEGKLAAGTNEEQAARRVAELEASVAELAITSPIDGVAQGHVVAQGELVRPGSPLVSIVDPQEEWVRFNLTEGPLSNVQGGTALRVRVPVLGNQEVLVKTTHRK